MTPILSVVSSDGSLRQVRKGVDSPADKAETILQALQIDAQVSPVPHISQLTAEEISVASKTAAMLIVAKKIAPEVLDAETPGTLGELLAATAVIKSADAGK